MATLLATTVDVAHCMKVRESEATILFRRHLTLLFFEPTLKNFMENSGVSFALSFDRISRHSALP